MKNLTYGKPLKLIFYFALPLMFGNILQQVYTLVDTMIVGQFLGVDALASLGAADWINWAILGIIMGLTQGFSIRISHLFGANENDQLSHTTITIYILSFIVAVLLTIGMQFIIHPLLTLLNTPDIIIQGSITYLRVISSGIIIVMFYNCFSSILRALGDSKTPLIAMIIAAIIHILLDLLFVCVFHLGIGGAALATIVAQCFAAIFSFIVLKRKMPHLFELKDYQFKLSTAKRLLKLGMPLALQNTIISIGGIVVQSVVNGFGFLFVAGFTATNKLYGLLEVAAVSFGYAITTFNSQNFGAKYFDRMKEGVKNAGLLSLATSLLIAFIMIFYGKFFLSLFISGTPSEVSAVLSVSYKYLFIMSCFYVCVHVSYPDVELCKSTNSGGFHTHIHNW